MCEQNEPRATGTHSGFRKQGIQLMKKRSLICSVMLVLLVAATHQVEGRDQPSEPAVDTAHSDNALKTLSGATQFIEAAAAFSAKGNFGGDLILDNGQIVEHASSFTLVFSRPAKLYLQINTREGYQATMLFDGETITLANIHDGLHVYDTTPQPGDVNESLDFMVGLTGGPRELNFFLTQQLTQSLNRMRTGFFVGESKIGDVLCDHLAMRTDIKDGQVWIERGDEPRPWRILITHREEPAQPRFWIQFDEWDFSPEFSESTFKYTPPEGAVKSHYFSE
jgi:hypothetical protein